MRVRRRRVFASTHVADLVLERRKCGVATRGRVEGPGGAAVGSAAGASYTLEVPSKGTRRTYMVKGAVVPR